jgi:hypothetical protein
MIIKIGEFYHCWNTKSIAPPIARIPDPAELLAEIVDRPSILTEFSYIGRQDANPDVPSVWYEIIASREIIFSNESHLYCSYLSSFVEHIIEEVPIKDLPLFIGWDCTKRYQDLLQSIL